jgi:16S rRNA (cytidine1402-2'-O)-methyltransferase
LFIVASPIGNLRDITLRAIEVLGSVALIAAEDTRHSRKLLSAYGIKTRLVSVNAHSERAKSALLLKEALLGKDIAYLSDAGTPGISDPGYLLINGAIASGIQVIPIPGASAGVAALSVSGLPMHRFLFVGFLPHNGNARKKALQELRTNGETLILYEAPTRLLALLRDALMVMGDRTAFIAREMTKIHEELRRGLLSELLSVFSDREVIKGEVTLIIAGCQEREADISEQGLKKMVRQLMEEDSLSHSQATRTISEKTGISRGVIYRLLLDDK